MLHFACRSLSLYPFPMLQTISALCAETILVQLRLFSLIHPQAICDIKSYHEPALWWRRCRQWPLFHPHRETTTIQSRKSLYGGASRLWRRFLKSRWSSLSAHWLPEWHCHSVHHFVFNFSGLRKLLAILLSSRMKLLAFLQVFQNH